MQTLIAYFFIGAVGAFFFSVGLSEIFKYRLPISPGMAALYGVGTGATLGLSGWLVGFYISRRLAKLWGEAETRLLVEGPYLRIIRAGIYDSDRRIHFRDLYDYEVESDPMLRRYGIRTLRIRILGRDGVRNSILLTGLVDPLKVRDQLCEIDAAREQRT